LKRLASYFNRIFEKIKHFIEKAIINIVILHSTFSVTNYFVL